MYQVVVERSGEKDLKRLSVEIRSRVATVLRSLATNPRPTGSRKLAGTKHDWRVRVGDYLPLATRWAIWDSRGFPAKRLATSAADDVDSVRELIER